MVTDYLLPQNQEAEMAVIGAMLLERDAALTAVELLQPEDFFNERARQAYIVLRDMVMSGRFLDFVLVGEEIKRRGLSDAIPGLFLTDAVTLVPAAAGVKYYSGIVRAKATQRKLMRLGNDLMAKAQSGEDDVNALVRRMYSSLDTIAGNPSGKGTVCNAHECAKLAIRDIDEELREQGNAGGIYAPLPSIARVLKPAKPGQFIVLAGRPGMGKSAFALQWAWHAAASGKHVLYISLEMSHAEMGERLLNAAATSPTACAVENARRLSSVDEAMGIYHAAATAYENTSLYVLCPDEKLSMADVMMYARLQRVRTGLDMVIIDYLGLMCPNTRQKTEYEAMTDISRDAKGLARALKVPVIGVQQLNRTSEDRSPRIPSMRDLKGSGSFEQDANAVVLLYRPGYWAHQDGCWKESEAASKTLNYDFQIGDDKSTAIIVAKQRRARPGLVFAKFEPDQQWFREDTPVC